ncbi:MAG: hypothetical protein EPN61_18405 [Burkholderiaceae bacterium]|nr:MAG: hypothetical protein EPN61_18405 [Burkholderiaceae bacterium]
MTASGDPTTTPQHALDALVASMGGPGEVLGLLQDYRQLVAALATERNPAMVLPNMRCFWTRKQKTRLAVDLPAHARAPFLRD